MIVKCISQNQYIVRFTAMALQVIKGNTLLLWITSQSHQTEWKREHGKKNLSLACIPVFGICLKFSPMLLFLLFILCFFFPISVCFISACLTQIKVDFSLFRSDFFSFGRTFSRLVVFPSISLSIVFFFSWTFTQNSMELAVGRCMFKWNTELHEMHFWYRLSVSQLLSNLKALSHVEKVKTWKIQEEKNFFSLAHS